MEMFLFLLFVLVADSAAASWAQAQDFVLKPEIAEVFACHTREDVMHAIETRDDDGLEVAIRVTALVDQYRCGTLEILSSLLPGLERRGSQQADRVVELNIGDTVVYVPTPLITQEWVDTQLGDGVQ